MRLTVRTTGHPRECVCGGFMSCIVRVVLANLGVFASASRISPAPDDRCGLFFDAELALRRSGHLNSVTLPGKRQWTEKYVTTSQSTAVNAQTKRDTKCYVCPAKNVLIHIVLEQHLTC